MLLPMLLPLPVSWVIPPFPVALLLSPEMMLVCGLDELPEAGGLGVGALGAGALGAGALGADAALASTPPLAALPPSSSADPLASRALSPSTAARAVEEGAPTSVVVPSPRAPQA